MPSLQQACVSRFMLGRERPKHNAWVGVQ
jgi:hypothetical protein